MQEIILFDHNETGYQDLIETLKYNRCATINHATGTGKSFIALKYLYENRDKKYLYIAPTYQIIDQLRDSSYDIGINPEELNYDSMIYTNLLNLDMKELYEKYDGIIFDEYHRIGADKTYEKIKELKQLLENHTRDKKFIGLTATPIRYLDNERNMTDEIFDGVVASKLSLSEAMLEDLLPIPTYVNSIMSCMGEAINAERTIEKLPEGEAKRKLQEKLQVIKEKIENNPTNMQKMIEPYIKEENGKYIVFCSNIQELNKVYEEIDKWFPQFNNVKKFKVHSKQNKEDNNSNLKEFNNQKDGLSVLLCVDVLNEGVHAKGVTGVFLLRRTQSPIIYFQQIGRALSFSGRKKQIIIFDVQNNFGNHSAIEEVYEEFRQEVYRKIELHPEREAEYKEKLEKFKIMDETRNILQEINSIRDEAKIIYNLLTCINEYNIIEKNINRIEEDWIREQLLEKLYNVKEKIDAINIDSSKTVYEYKEINKEILNELKKIKEQYTELRRLNYRFSCERKYKLLKRQIDELPDSKFKAVLQGELEEVHLKIQEWKMNSSRTVEETKKLNEELLEILDGIQKKYKELCNIYRELTCIKKIKRVEKHIKWIENAKEYKDIKVEFDLIKDEINKIDINNETPLEKYQEIDKEYAMKLDELDTKIIYLHNVYKVLSCMEKIEKLVRMVGKIPDVKEKESMLKEIQSVKEKVQAIKIDYERPVEEYKKINDEIMKELNKINRHMRYINYRNKCILEWKSTEARILSMGNTDEKTRLLQELESYKKRITSIKINPKQPVEQYIEDNGDIAQEIKNLRKQVTNEMIIKTQIDGAIKILANFRDINTIFANKEAKAAYAKISKYAKRVNNEQFAELAKLDILLPEALSATEEERQEMLGKYSSIYEKERNEKDDNIEEIIKYIRNNGRQINLKSTEEEERIMAEKYLKIITALTNEQGQRLFAVFEENNISLKTWEKVLLDQPIEEEQIDELIIEAKKYLDIEIALPEYLYVAINTILGKYETKKYTILLSILDKADQIEQSIKEGEEQERYNRVTAVIEQIADNMDLPEAIDDDILEKMKKMTQEERAYVKRKYALLKGKQFESWLKNTETSGITEFCKKMKSISTDEVERFKEMLEEDLQLYATINGIVSFMKDNDNRYPNAGSENQQETKIAEKIKEFIQRGKLDSRFEDLENDFNSPWYNMKVIINGIVSARFQSADIKRAVVNAIVFFKKHGRRPLKNSEDEEEARLAQEYEKICIGLLPQGDITMLNKIFNTKQNLSNTIEAYVRNMQKGRD